MWVNLQTAFTGRTINVNGFKQFIVEKCLPDPFEFNLRPNIHYRVQIWTLTWSFHEPDGLVLKTLLGDLCSIGKKITSDHSS